MTASGRKSVFQSNGDIRPTSKPTGLTRRGALLRLSSASRLVLTGSLQGATLLMREPLRTVRLLFTETMFCEGSHVLQDDIDKVCYVVPCEDSIVSNVKGQPPPLRLTSRLRRTLLTD